MGKKVKVSKKNRWLTPIMLGVICIGAFLLRVLPQWNKVFVNGQVWFREVDPWYHMRLVDNLMGNFPHLLKFDMYAQYPDGSGNLYFPFMHWLIAGIGQFLNYELVAAFLPPVVGALILIPVYFICKELLSKREGILACLLVAILPGEFLHRSLLGFTDHHFLEVFLMVSTLLLLILTYKYKKWLWRILAGITLGFYMLNWAGSALFLLIIGVWLWIEALRGKFTIEHCKAVSIPVVIALAMSLWFINKEALIASILLIVAPIVLVLFQKVIKSRKFTFVLILLVPLALICYFHNPILGVFWGGATTISEADPITLPVLVHTYGITFFLAAAGLYFYIKSRRNTLFLIWTIILMLVTIGQRRWGYYTTIPVSILAAYFVFCLSDFVKQEVRTAATVVVCFFLIMPMVTQIKAVSNLPNNITPDWYNSLVWLRENSSEPCSPDAYNELNSSKVEYGVLSWWDYGHWIIRISHRVPLSSPTKSSGIPSKFLTAQSKEEATKVLTGLNIKYVIIDKELLEGKWYAIVRNAGLKVEDKNKILGGSMLMKLWTREVEGYKLVHEWDTVKVFEVVND